MTKSFVRLLSLCGVCVVLTLAVSRPLYAQDSASGTELEAPVDMYQPMPVQADGAILNVATASVAGHLQWSGGLVYTQAMGLAEIAVLDRDGQVVREETLLDQQITAELSGVIGLYDLVDIGLVVPVSHQQVGPNVPDGDAGVALDELRVYPRIGLLQRDKYRPDSGFGVAFLAPVSLPIGGAKAFVSDGSVGVEPTLALDWRHRDGWTFASNLGYVWRVGAGGADAGRMNAMSWALAARVPLIRPSLSADISVAGLAGADASASAERLYDEADRTPVEMVAALRWRDDSGLVASVGAGRGLTQSVGSSSLRLTASLGWAPASPVEPRPEQSTVADEAPSAPQEPIQEPVDDKPAAEQVAAEASDGAADEADADGDGIAGAADKCPEKLEDYDGFEDDDGCPDDDNDQDGIPDQHDRCPNAEAKKGEPSRDGCPIDNPEMEATVEALARIEKEEIVFAYDSHKLESKSYVPLKELATLIKQNPRLAKIRIEGHTDNVGGTEYNRKLSTRRASTVYEFLIQKGVDADRLMIQGYGESQPRGDNTTEEGRAQNRRIEFIVVDLDRD